MSNTILKVIVGSRMWGTATPESDTDYKEVIMAPLADVLNPFKNHGKGVQKQNDDNDSAVYELMHLLRLIEKGNPTMLELLYTPLVVEETHVGNELRANRHAWIDSDNTVKATLGMAKAQLNRAARYEEADEDDKRIGKLYASTILSLSLSNMVLGSGGMMRDLEPTPYRDFILSLKAGDKSSYHDALEVIVDQSTILRGFERLCKMKADREHMAEFCHHWYTKQEKE